MFYEELLLDKDYNNHVIRIALADFKRVNIM